MPELCKFHGVPLVDGKCNWSRPKPNPERDLLHQWYYETLRQWSYEINPLQGQRNYIPNRYILADEKIPLPEPHQNLHWMKQWQ